MKKMFDKKIIYGVIIGGVLFGSIGVLATNYLYKSDQISYTSNKTDKTNVDEALDELYNLSLNSDSSSISTFSNIYTIKEDGTYFIATTTYGGWVDGKDSRNVNIYIKINGETKNSVSSKLYSATFHQNENKRDWYIGAPNVTYKAELIEGDVVTVGADGNTTIGSITSFIVKVK